MKAAAVAAVLAVLVSAAAGEGCPSGGIYGENFDKCYIFVKESVTFEGARKICANNNGYLVSIHSAFENAFVIGHAEEVFGDQDYWIGLIDPLADGVWEWQDGSDVSYTSWATGFPINGKAMRCVASVGDMGKWYNTVCDDEQPGVVCETEPSAPVTSTPTPSPSTPLPTCDPSVSKFDVVLVFDSSDNVGVDEFKKVVSAFFAIPLNVVIGPNNNRFMLGYYTSFTEYFPTASYIEDSNPYMNALYSLETIGYSGEHGNNIYSIFSTLNITLFREDFDVQKLVIFFSSTPWTDGPAGTSYPDPHGLVSSFRRADVNVLPIGYGPLASYEQLSVLGCAQMVNNADELDALMPWIISLFCRTNPVC